MKLSRKLVPAVLLFLVSVLLITTTTLAWFSINSEVSVTGMQVTATASDNLMVYSTYTTVRGEDALFHNAVVLPHEEVKLAPASSADGAEFYYVEGHNVNGAGGTIFPMGYVRYDEGSPESLNQFNENYRTTGSVAYTEYAFQLKATNAQDFSQDVVINLLDLTYGGTTVGTQKAFRVAIFADLFPEDADPDDGVLPAVTTETLVSILGPEGALYRSNRNEGGSLIGQTVGADVNGDLEMRDVALFGADAVLGTVAEGETLYYRVIVRLWLEGEDTTCGNATFAPLGDAWALDLSIAFASDSVKPVNSLNNMSVAGKTVIYTDGQNGFAVDTEHGTEVDEVLYYPIKRDGVPIAFGVRETFPVTLFTTDTCITTDSVIYALAYDATYGIYRYPIDVTNRIGITVSRVDLGAAVAVAEGALTVGDPSAVYYPIVGKTLNGQQLYTPTVGELTDTSVIYTVYGDRVNDVSGSCILPSTEQ